MTSAVVEFVQTQPPGESETVRLFFWGVVFGSYAMTWVQQRGERNFSTVDRLWALMPTIYGILWTHEHYLSDGYLQVSSKAAFVQTVVFVWTVHHTRNFWRRGGFSVGFEDHRWAHVRGQLHKVLGCLYAAGWEVFNFGFIALFQHALLYGIALPLRLLQDSEVEKGWSMAEYGLAGVMCLALVVEIAADGQQYAFQQRKLSGANSAEVRAGFVHSGLFKYARHPNVFCEQILWVALAAFALAATGAPVSGLYCGGACGLVVLTLMSVRLTEAISASKYPLYRAYQLKTSSLVPCMPRSNESVIQSAAKRQ